MNRKHFLKSLLALPLSVPAMKLQALKKYADTLPLTQKMPVLFLGHGSPMNAIEENEFVKGFRSLGNQLTKPNAVLCISAHWETKGTFVTAMSHPRTIHDFGGFPRELFEVEYPAPGNPELAEQATQLITTTKVQLDHKWGLDHGAWVVIKHLFPQANIPVIQLSIDYTQPAQYHYELAQQLAVLRHKGVLIVGSGNMVHNLRMVNWAKMNEYYAYDWAIEAIDKMKNYTLNGDLTSLINFRKQGKAFDLAIPTPEHYLPLIYSLAVKDGEEEVSIFNDKPLAGSLYMTSVVIGKV